jgi:hypothetical protein
MTRSPFTRLNAEAIRAERVARLEGLGHTLAALILAAGLCALGIVVLHTALAIPELTARAAAQARW